MHKLIIGLLGAIAIFAGALWFQPQLLSITGLDNYAQTAYFSLANSLGKSNNKKCTTANGEVIYGTITKPDDCLKIESIDTHITVVKEETLVEGETIVKGETSEAGSSLSRKSLHSTNKFNCDGRTHCSQMKSCAQARLFLANCSGMKVDGDQDGIPCERQWCG